jgi:membrane-bound metal-dependent hydrolase YbcI (DUF457 family)
VSTLVGHALAATLATSTAGGERVPRRGLLVSLAIVVALLPDLDVAIFLALRPAGMVPHRGVSHTLLFALASATVMTLLASRWLGGPSVRLWCVFLLAAASHPLLDYLMGAGPAVPFFAPVWDRGYLFPRPMLPIAYYGKATRAFADPSFWALNALAAGLEVVTLGPLVLLTRRALPGRTRLLAVAVSLAGVLLTMGLYRPM